MFSSIREVRSRIMRSARMDKKTWRRRKRFAESGEWNYLRNSPVTCELQISRDLEQSFPNTTAARASIYSWMNALASHPFCRGRRGNTGWHALRLQSEPGRNEWKFGGDGMLTWDYNYFPSLYGGEYLYDNISVESIYVCAAASGTGVDSIAGMGA